MRILMRCCFVVALAVTLLMTPGCATFGPQLPSSNGNSNTAHGSQESAWDQADDSFQEGSEGVYVSGGNTANGKPFAGGAAGVFRMPTSTSTVRYGVVGLDSEGIGAGGAEAGLRFHAPTRFTPYFGLSGVAGFSGVHNVRARNRYNHTSQQNRLVTLPAGQQFPEVEKRLKIRCICAEAFVNFRHDVSSLLVS